MNHGQAVCSVNLLISYPRGLGPPRVFANPSCKESGVLVSDTNNHHSSSKSGSGSDKHRLPLASFLPGAPENLQPTKLGLLVPSTDPAVVGRWLEPSLVNFCRDIDGRLLGFEEIPHVRIFRIPGSLPPSTVVIDRVECLQMTWPDIPAMPEAIDSLVFKAAANAGFHVPNRAITMRKTEKNGCWYRIRLTDLLEVGEIWMRGGAKKWRVRMHRTSNSPGSTTASVVTRPAE